MGCRIKDMPRLDVEDALEQVDYLYDSSTANDGNTILRYTRVADGTYQRLTVTLWDNGTVQLQGLAAEHAMEVLRRYRANKQAEAKLQGEVKQEVTTQPTEFRVGDIVHLRGLPSSPSMMVSVVNDETCRVVWFDTMKHNQALTADKVLLAHGTNPYEGK